jgi:vacuolar-type H+-ATPase catalytic subunit A/Vma1
MSWIFKRKNAQGQEEDRPVTQEELDGLERNAATLEEVTQLFGEDAEQEDFNLTTTVEEILESHEAIGAAFGEEAEAEGFDPVARITELQSMAAEHAEITKLAENLKGKTLVERLKTLKPTGKTNAVKKGLEKAESENQSTRFQDYPHNQKMIKELRDRGVTLESVDYSQLN